MTDPGLSRGVASGMLPLALPQPDSINREGEFQMIQRGEFRKIVDTCGGRG
jgi:hypothetical protein